MPSTNKKLVIGRTDRIDFPSLDLFGLPCKIDTGATTSAIHCHHVKIVEKEGHDYLRFQLLDPKHVFYNNKEFEFAEFEERSVKNTSGIAEDRYVIKTQVLLFGILYDIKLTLADRERMTYPVLLGRTFLHKKFIVDVSKNKLSHKEKCKFLIESSRKAEE